MALAQATTAPTDAQGVVARVIDANTLRLVSGDRIRLADIQAPRRGFGRPGVTDWPLALQARAFVDRLARGKSVRVESPWRDRYGRIVGTVRADASESLQERLIAAGFARVYPTAGRERQVAALLTVEAQARAAGKGIWKHPFYRVRDHRSLRKDIGSYQLVAGTVQRVAFTRRMVYLNFGWNWREDFTVAIRRQTARRFAAAGIDLAAFEGRRVRVRGWLFERNGPMIAVRTPGQIELLAKD